MAKVAAWLAMLGAVALPALASAQHYTSNLETRRVKAPTAPLSDRLAVFINPDYDYADWDVSFDVESVNGDEDGENFSQQLVFDASNMRVTKFSPQIGLSYAASPDLLLHVSAGIAMIKLEERLVSIPGSNYGNQHEPIFSYDLAPGLAATAGAMYEVSQFADFTIVTGLRLAYTSSSHIEEEAVNGSQTFDETNKVTIKEESTQDVSINLLQATANAGLEWRPRSSYLSNHFGLTLSYGYSFGEMVKAVKLEQTVDGTTDSSEASDTVGFSMTPSNIVGVYYGWTLFIPRFGNLGVEVRALNTMAASLNYEYIF